MTEKFLMARNFYRIFTENNPVMGDSKTFGIPEAKGLKDAASKKDVSGDDQLVLFALMPFYLNKCKKKTFLFSRLKTILQSGIR